MRNIGGNEDDFAGPDLLRSLSFDLDREISVQDGDDFLTRALPSRRSFVVDAAGRRLII
jgi:hypothetical protein